MSERTHHLRVCFRAVQWWRRKRPVSWCEVDHLANPAVNTTTDAEAALARAIADAVVAGWRSPSEPPPSMPKPRKRPAARSRRPGGGTR